MRNRELTARIIAAVVVAAAVLVPLAIWLRTPLVHARVAEAGGWGPDVLHARVGQPLLVRLTSDDVVHGFAIGLDEAPPVDVIPGKVSQTWLEFDRPGTYTFYCTRWCGPNHWRMRGTIEVEGEVNSVPPTESPPLYQRLGIDLDQPHPASVLPASPPDARRGRELAATHLVQSMPTEAEYRSLSPAAEWERLRSDPTLAALPDGALWDLVAFTYTSQLTQDSLDETQQLYASNCAACHGEKGDGQGVFANSLAPASDMTALPSASKAGGLARPADFTDAATMLGASPALLQGKILRGGMGSGMPMWGAILTDDQMWNLVSYLYLIQFGKGRVE